VLGERKGDNCVKRVDLDGGLEYLVINNRTLKILILNSLSKAKKNFLLKMFSDG